MSFEVNNVVVTLAAAVCFCNVLSKIDFKLF